MLLLPLGLFSDFTAGLTLAFNATDNIQFLNIKDQGATITISPFMRYQGFITCSYDGSISLIGLDQNNLFSGHDVALIKHMFLPGVGNKNTLYMNAYVLLTSTYDIYRMNEYSLGDSLAVYIARKYHFIADLNGGYIEYRDDSLTDYLQAHLTTSLSIPMPYFFLIPQARVGIRTYEDETLPFYGGSVDIDLPLTLDFSMSAAGTFLRHTDPTSNITTLAYADDPFFEKENLEQTWDIMLGCTKLFLTQRSRLNLSIQWYDKRFFEMDDLGRQDQGFLGRVTLTHTIDRHSLVSVGYSYMNNSSTLVSFTYDKNTVDLSLQLLFW